MTRLECLRMCRLVHELVDGRLQINPFWGGGSGWDAYLRVGYLGDNAVTVTMHWAHLDYVGSDGRRVAGKRRRAQNLLSEIHRQLGGRMNSDTTRLRIASARALRKGKKQ